MNRISVKQIVYRAILAVAPFVLALPAMGSGMGPSGINIGFDFNWASAGEPLGNSASFIQTVLGDGSATLNNCGGPVTSATQACDFPFTYSINSVNQTNVPVPGGVYGTWASAATISGNPNATFCDTNPSNSAPLTLFNCFNTNSFGQIFADATTGALTGFTMPMTCLNPAGGAISGLVASIYQVNGGGTSIPSTPLGSVAVDLSSCPTLTSWASHHFSSADFASIPLNFSGVSLTAGTEYGVFFTGTAVPGSPLPTGTTPEPATLLLAALGFGLVALGRRAGAARIFGRN